MLQRILVALDGSRLAEQTLPYASAVARAFGAEVILLRVVETPPGAAGRAIDSFHWRLERAEAIAYLEGIDQRLTDEGIRVDLDVTAGRACEEILELARAREVDLIVLASHGAGGVTQFRMASTAHKVAFATDRSVLVVPAREEAFEPRPFESVLVPVDCTPHSDWALAMAAAVARAEQVDLVVLHVVQRPQLIDPQGTPHEREIVDEIVTRNRAAAMRYVEGVRRRLEAPNMSVRGRIEVADDLTTTLRHLMGAESRPLVILGSRNRGRVDEGPFGSLVSVMLASSRCPVLILRQPSQKRRATRRWLRSEQPSLRRTPLSAG